MTQEYEKLLGELETMAKAIPAEGDGDGDDQGDGKIAAAAAGDNDGDEAGTAGDEGEDGKAMTKSLKVTLADGTEVEAEDGTALVKSLIDRLDESEAKTTETNGVMAKAMGVAVDLIKSQGKQIAAMGKLVKSLQTNLAEISNEGRGRKTTVSVHETPAGTMAKSQPDGMDEKEFMAKAMTAMQAGKISGYDISTAEACLNRGQAIPEHIVARVIS